MAVNLSALLRQSFNEQNREVEFDCSWQAVGTTLKNVHELADYVASIYSNAGIACEPKVYEIVKIDADTKERKVQFGVVFAHELFQPQIDSIVQVTGGIMTRAAERQDGATRI
jgi:hypothetical protein